jgi:hypothetical protein
VVRRYVRSLQKPDADDAMAKLSPTERWAGG